VVFVCHLLGLFFDEPPTPEAYTFPYTTLFRSPPTERAKGFISVEQFTHTLQQIKPYTNYIYFHLKGEPLLHPKLDQLLDIAHERSEEHTSELQSRENLVCRLLPE